jgi:hypothetical protein
MEEKYITTTQALELVKQTTGTPISRTGFINWVRAWQKETPDICKQPFGKMGRLFINKDLLKERISETQKR